MASPHQREQLIEHRLEAPPRRVAGDDLAERPDGRHGLSGVDRRRRGFRIACSSEAFGCRGPDHQMPACSVSWRRTGRRPPAAAGARAPTGAHRRPRRRWWRPSRGRRCSGRPACRARSGRASSAARTSRSRRRRTRRSPKSSARSGACRQRPGCRPPRSTPASRTSCSTVGRSTFGSYRSPSTRQGAVRAAVERQLRGGAHHLDAGHLADPVQPGDPRSGLPFRVVRVVRSLQADAGDDDPVGVEPEGHRGDVAVALQHQRGAVSEREQQPELGDDQDGLQPRRPPCADKPSPSVRRAPGQDRRPPAPTPARARPATPHTTVTPAENARTPPSMPIPRGPLDGRRDHAPERVARPTRRQARRRPRRSGDHKALGDALPREPPGRRAERDPNRRLRLASGRPGQKEARHVRRADDHEDADRREEEPERPPHVAGDAVRQRLHAGRSCARWLRVLARQAAPRRATTSRSAASRERPGASRPRPNSQCRSRLPASAPGSSGIQNSPSASVNHGRGLSNPGGITPMTVKAAPFSVTWRPTIRGSAPNRRRQRPSPSTSTRSSRRSSSSVKSRPRAGPTPSARRKLAEQTTAFTRSGKSRPPEVRPLQRLDAEFGERPGALTPVQVVGIGERLGDSHPRRRRPGDHQPIGFGVRQRVENDGLEHAEDGGARADAEREQQHHRHGEARRARRARARRSGGPARARPRARRASAAALAPPGAGGRTGGSSAASALPLRQLVDHAPTRRLRVRAAGHQLGLALGQVLRQFLDDVRLARRVCPRRDAGAAERPLIQSVMTTLQDQGSTAFTPATRWSARKKAPQTPRCSASTLRPAGVSR